MTIHLSLEASYRLHERLGFILGDRPCPPALWDDVAMGAMRWQRKNDKDAVTTPHKRPASPVLEAE